MKLLIAMMKYRKSKLVLLTILASILSACPVYDVRKLTEAEVMQGRLPGSAGSLAAQNFIIERVSPHARGLMGGTGSNSYKQFYNGGTNILAVVPGTDLANEYVMVGAHFDHLGSRCDTARSSDVVCDGASDNATGVAAAIDIAKRMTDEKFQGRRSLILAFWDQEEFGLLGSRHYVNNPVKPLNNVVAYINFDILGTNVMPNMLESSLIIAAESGGNVLQNAMQEALNASEIAYRQLTSSFGNRLSDHTNFLSAGVPSVFFTDGIGACYHTAQDEFETIDFRKLEKQIDVASGLTRRLLNSNAKPRFQTAAVNRNDAQQLLNHINQAAISANRFTQADRDRYPQLVQLFQSGVDHPNFILSNSLAEQTLIAAREISTAFRAAGPCEPFHSNE
ncbi:MAG: M28 family metallopeptidase [Pseudomonadales bacterium]